MEEKLKQIKLNIIKYIETNDFEEIQNDKQNFVRKIQQELKSIYDELGINNLNYSGETVEEISMELQKLIEQRKDNQIEKYIDIIQSEFKKIIDEKENIDNSKLDKNEDFNEAIKKYYIDADEKIEETKIDYREQIVEIISDKIKELTLKISRTLDNIGLSQERIDEIAEMHYKKISEINLLVDKMLNDKLVDGDIKIKKYIQTINEDYIAQIINENEKQTAEEEFRSRIEVENEGNTIEKKAINNLEEHNKSDRLLDAEDLFENKNNDKKTQNKTYDLDPSDIF